ncbi:diacylglycerol/lipid kinase family protein [Candidatus Formimonas warabiya]|uniref:DAGKc domain-containing protein n=1 Tax=Formimonas warabiya TaxID=1761012 RepID=A0A3G1KN74_FORW1|nr:diacylglycerol kinase family protein [Candidatus Formimonas warabiya]ATW23908.1 hypothetical protein DCMF_03045 [Candidatus Formimonas warabiya]
MSKIYFIVNPCAGNGATRRWWLSYLPVLDRTGLNFQWSFTQGPFTAPAIAAQAVDSGYDILVAVGGDGTVHEVVNGIIRNSGFTLTTPALAIWPRGTGCDLGRTLGIRNKKEDLIGLLSGGEAIWVDVGQAEFISNDGEKNLSRYFLNVAEVGLGGETAAKVNETTKVLGGFFSFLWGSLTSICTYRSPYLRMVIDEKHSREGRYTLIACGNGRFFGGGMMICPKAKINDGYFDIVAIEAMGKSNLIYNLPKVYSGRHLEHAKVWHARAKSLLIQSRGRVLVNLDGEQPGIVQAKFTIIPKAIKLLVPKQFPTMFGEV